MNENKWVEKVYVVNNGDIFFRHNRQCIDPKEFDINSAKKEAQEMLDNGEFEIVYDRSPRNVVTSYYNLSGGFLGNGDMHVTESYNEVQNYIYLEKNNDHTLIKETKKFFDVANRR